MKLKSKMKALAAAVLIGLSGTAAADVIPGTANPGAGELFFSIWSPSLATSYTRDLGINVNNFFAGGTTAPVDTAGPGVDYAVGSTISYAAGNVLTPGYFLNFGTDAVLSSSGLLAAADAIWNVVGVRSFGTPDRLFTTTNVANPAPTSAGVVTSVSRITTWLTGTGGVNAVMPGTLGTTNDSITAASPALAYAGSTSFGPTLGGAGGAGVNSTGSVGGTLSFYEFDESGVTAAVTTGYTGGFWALANDGGLTWEVSAAPVPVPGALVLLLSGLLGVVGVGRRKAAA